MRFGLIALALLLGAIPGAAKEIKVRKAWVRTFPNTSLAIMPDNRGHIAAVGSETNSAIALLLNTRGRRIAKASVPIPGVAGATADSSGRIFITGNEYPSVTVHCAAFAPSLSGLLWIQTNNIGYLYPPPGLWTTLGPLTADEAGGVFVMGDWQAGLFMTQFHSAGSLVKGIYVGLQTPYRTAGALARSRSGDAFFVGNAVSFRDGWVTVVKWNPVTSEYTTYGLNSPGINGYATARAAACDAEGNLIIVGQQLASYTYPFRGRCFTMKLDANANVIWKALHGPYDSVTSYPSSIALAVAVDQSGNIIMTGTAGTVKYAGDGRVLWEAPESGTMRLDRFGNVVLSQQVVSDDGIAETGITKLNVNGTRRWQTRFHDGSAYHNSPAGHMSDRDGNVYLATVNGESTTIVKFVEPGRRKE